MFCLNHPEIEKLKSVPSELKSWASIKSIQRILRLKTRSINDIISNTWVVFKTLSRPFILANFIGITTMDSDNSQYIGWYNPRTKHQLITNDQLYLHISHFWLFEIHIPSGNLTVCYGKSMKVTCFYKVNQWLCSKAMSNYRTVCNYHHISSHSPQKK